MEVWTLWVKVHILLRRQHNALRRKAYLLFAHTNEKVMKKYRLMLAALSFYTDLIRHSISKLPLRLSLVHASCDAAPVASVPVVATRYVYIC
jgi:hypothetical protein